MNSTTNRNSNNYNTGQAASHMQSLQSSQANYKIQAAKLQLQ